MLFAALYKGAAKCVGIDIGPDRVKVASEETTRRNLNTKANFIEADVMDVDFSKATVIFSYLCTPASEAFKPRFEKELKPGAKIVMEMFPIQGGISLFAEISQQYFRTFNRRGISLQSFLIMQ